MRFDAISVARQAGSLGEEIAARVAEKLNFQLLDVEIIRRAAAEAGVSEQTIERAEHAPTFLERILSSLAYTPAGPPFEIDTYGEPVPALTNERYRQLTEQVLRRMAVRGNVVIVGHAGQMALRQVPRAMKVLLHAPFDFRAANLSREAGLRAEEGRDKLQESDKERDRFFNMYYKVRWLDATLYDLSLDTSVFAIEDATRIIAEAAG